MSEMDRRGIAAGDPVGIEAVAELARSLAGCEGACVRLADDGLGRPAIRFFPHRSDAGDLPEAFLPADLPPIAGARELAGIGFWAGLPLHDGEGNISGLLGVYDGQNRNLGDKAMGDLLALARVLSSLVALAHEGGAKSILPAAPAAARNCYRFDAFARLRIGEALHDIGRCESTDRMAFRLSGSSEMWTPLMHGFEDGWPEVAAEIIARTRNALRDYIRMHMIRNRDADVTPGEREYDLYGILWRVRGTVDAAEVWQSESGWKAFDTTPVVECDDPRDLAAQALISAVPDLDARIGGDVKGWARRLAQGAQISPILTAA
ncbi:MAG: hypothetical protein RIR62_833 [Pseudomonadota bacterium]